jgi:wobble nucleotide-excising tRNase
LLEKIISIKGVGLLHDANGARHTLKKATFLYADNGRGKSTSASILRSCSTDDASLISSRSTISGTNPQEVKLLFNSGHQVKFENGAWSEKRDEILVFDADFVEKNVYSGGEVSPSQRQNLLQFALGANAVTAQSEYDGASVQHQTDTQVQSQAEQTLQTHHTNMTLRDFEKVASVPNVATIIADLQVRIADAKNIAAIRAKAVPVSLTLPHADINPVLSVCERSIDDIDVDAEQRVTAHLDKHNNINLAGWISTGNSFESDENCPYCDQSLEGVDLIAAYKTYFNQEYRNLKILVIGMERQIESIAGDTILANFLSHFDQAHAIAAAWQSNVVINMPVIDRVSLQAKLANARTVLDELRQLKERDILSTIDVSSYRLRFDQAWGDLARELWDIKQKMDQITSGINTYKANLSQANLQQLEQELIDAQWAGHRHQQPIIDLFKDLASKRVTKKASAALKQTKKDALNLIMETTLNIYRTNINALLTSFNAAFKISEIDVDYRGGLRSSYTIEMRGATISMGGTAPDFRTSMSESDKRTFAFAFFVASVLADPNLANKIVVIDDPMCSLDFNRQHQTRVALKKIFDQCSQLIVLAHDANFLQRLKKDIKPSCNPADICSMRLQPAASDFSDFADIDLEQECETGYFKIHRKLEEYLNGGNHNKEDVARSIRPMLEGYLHRRFPGKLPADLMFGAVLALINSAQAPSPLVHAQNITQELDEIKNYVGQFHHDTNPHYDQVVAVDAEVRAFAQRALDVIYKSAS